MGNIFDMIERLCPDGVEFVKLNKICCICDGTHQTPEYTSSGVKFVSVENINNLYETDKYISETDYNKYKVKPQINDVLMTRIGSVGVCAVIDRDIPLAYYVSLALLRPDNNIILSKYLKYVIESRHGRKELDKRTLIYAVPIKVNTGDIGKITIPVPPIEVQREIVRILDSFTDYINCLKNELKLRKKQYAYYRDKLFTFGDDVEQKTLSEICTVITKGTTPKYYEKSEVAFIKTESFNGRYIDKNKLSFVSYEMHNNFLKRSILQENDILFTIAGATIGKMAIVTKDLLPANTNQALAIIRLKHIEDVEYIKYILESRNMKDYIKSCVKGSAQPNLSLKQLNDFKFPIPPIWEQERIVKILDTFTKIMELLKRETELRQKQYKYYRDKIFGLKRS